MTWESDSAKLRERPRPRLANRLARSRVTTSESRRVACGWSAPARDQLSTAGRQSAPAACQPSVVERHENRSIAVSMKIDIDKLAEADFVDLNNRIVARLRFLNQMRAHSEMLEFRIGDRVPFDPDGRPPVVGVLTRYNKKSVTIIAEDGQRWIVSPGLLRKAQESKQTNPGSRNVLSFPKK